MSQIHVHRYMYKAMGLGVVEIITIKLKSLRNLQKKKVAQECTLYGPPPPYLLIPPTYIVIPASNAARAGLHGYG